MTSDRISTPRDLTLEDDGIELIEPPTNTTTSNNNNGHKPAASPRPGPASSESGESSDKVDTVTLLLQYTGNYARKKLRNGLSRAPTCPHLKELAKLRHYPESEPTDMSKANAKNKAMADPIPSHHFQPDYFRQESKEEKVLRVWIPLDPNENPNPNLQQTQIPSVHHWARPTIVALINTQIAATHKVFDVIQSHPDRYSTASRLNAASILSSLMGSGDTDPLRPMRDSHAILALRLKGVEVCEWVEDFDRMEVYFEDPGHKMGMLELGNMKRYWEGVERNKKLYGSHQ